MKPRSVRFSDDVWEVIEYEASREGVSSAQYVRDAALARAFYALGERGEDPGRSVAEILERLRHPRD
jgi:predicted DNA-binding protein